MSVGRGEGDFCEDGGVREEEEEEGEEEDGEGEEEEEEEEDGEGEEEEGEEEDGEGEEEEESEGEIEVLPGVSVSRKRKRKKKQKRTRKIRSEKEKQSLLKREEVDITAVMHTVIEISLTILYITVEPPNNGHFGDEHFVNCSEVVPSLEVEIHGQYIGMG